MLECISSPVLPPGNVVSCINLSGIGSLWCDGGRDEEGVRDSTKKEVNFMIPKLGLGRESCLG